jgi:ABC-type uncharacterized transport system substrate-binding protein
MDRRRFLLTSLAATVTTPLVVRAQREGKIARVGFLVMARNPGVESAFPRGLAELGYVEGRDVIIEWRSADGRSDQVAALAAELVQWNADIIVAAGPEARIAAMKGYGDNSDRRRGRRRPGGRRLGGKPGPTRWERDGFYRDPPGTRREEA